MRRTWSHLFLDGGKLNLLVEECDEIEIKIQARLMAREYCVPVVMETNDRCMLDIERFDLEPNREIFHSRLGDISWKEISGLKTAEDKWPFVAKIIGIDSLLYQNEVIND